MNAFFKESKEKKEGKKSEPKKQKAKEVKVDGEKKKGVKVSGYKFRLEPASKLKNALNKKLPMKIYLAKEDLKDKTVQSIRIRLHLYFNNHWYKGTGGEVIIVDKNAEKIFVQPIKTYKMNLGGRVFRLNSTEIIQVNLYRKKYKRDDKGQIIKKKNGRNVVIPNTRVKNEYTFNAKHQSKK